MRDICRTSVVCHFLAFVYNRAQQYAKLAIFIIICQFYPNEFSTLFTTPVLYKKMKIVRNRIPLHFCERDSRSDSFRIFNFQMPHSFGMPSGFVRDAWHIFSLFKSLSTVHCHFESIILKFSTFNSPTYLGRTLDLP